MTRILAFTLLIFFTILTGCQRKADDKAFLTAVLQGNTTVTRQYLDAGANIEVTNDSGRTPLALAALKSNAEMVTLLLAKGAKVNAQDPAGMTPLMWAAFGGNPHIVQELLAKGAEVTLKDAKGGTALTWAQKPEIVKLLKTAGARE